MDSITKYNGKHMGENDEVRRWFVEKLYFFHSGTNRKHNIIYKLTYTIIINHLHKFSSAFYRYKRYAFV